MSEGELKKRLRDILGTRGDNEPFDWWEGEFNSGEIIELLDEAKKEFPILIPKNAPPTNESKDVQGIHWKHDVLDWFEKWFGE